MNPSSYKPPINFVDESALIGYGTSIWHFAVILQQVIIGSDCSIGSGSEIGRGTRIGDGVRVGAHVFLPPKSVIGDRVFIGPGTVFTDDRHPIANNKGYKAEPPSVGNDAVVGAGCVILPGVRIGEGARIGAGSVVTKDVGSFTTLRGEPARIAGMVL